MDQLNWIPEDYRILAKPLVLTGLVIVILLVGGLAISLAVGPAGT